MPRLNKIAFIITRGPLYRYRTGAFGVFIRYAPLTIPFLVSLIPEDMSPEIEVYDEGVETINKEKINADLVAISSITGGSRRAYAYADYFRSKGVPVVMGGVHATLMTEEVLSHADAVVKGIAVRTWPQLLRDFEAGKMKRLYENEGPVDFANWPVPKRGCYRAKKNKFITINSVQASYGCPNSCNFCVTPCTVKGYHHRPIGDVVRDIKALDAKYIVFVDPSPIEDVSYAKELYSALIPLKKKWLSPCTIKMAFDDELLAIAAKSGCAGLLIGFESVAESSIADVGKSFNSPANYLLAMKKFHENGIAIMGCFVFGLDSDDKTVFSRTVDFVNEANVDLPRFTVCTPYPGTPLYKHLESEGRIIERDWLMYDCQHVVFRPAKMTAEELQAGHHWAWKEAYKIIPAAKRLLRSRASPEITLLTNIAYMRYVHALPRYNRAVMTDLSDI